MARVGSCGRGVGFPKGLVLGICHLWGGLGEGAGGWGKLAAGAVTVNWFRAQVFSRCCHEALQKEGRQQLTGSHVPLRPPGKPGSCRVSCP